MLVTLEDIGAANHQEETNLDFKNYIKPKRMRKAKGADKDAQKSRVVDRKFSGVCAEERSNAR